MLYDFDQCQQNGNRKKLPVILRKLFILHKDLFMPYFLLQIAVICICNTVQQNVFADIPRQYQCEVGGV